ncbi:MAG: beta-N-acetylhexosaminidase [Acholeplasmataceae bacterium]|nr:beta-N-acetylhexosaminidase [Acholeplasmataceae bacterium]
MKNTIINDLQIQKALEVMNQYLPLDLGEIQKIDFVLSNKPGYQINKDYHQIEVHYHSLNEAFAAVGYILTHKSKVTYKVSRVLSLESLGVMIDCARNAVPKIETFKEYIIHLSLLGYTYLGLYLEDLFEVDNEPMFGYMRGKYSKEELKDLVSFASHFGMEIIPYIQTLAHLNSIFRHNDYRSINDLNDILLVDEPRTYELIENMLSTAKSIFSTDKINIGMDEAWMLGLGKHLSKHGFENRMSIMTRHLDKVLSLCKKYELKPSMWADMFFHLTTGGYLNPGVLEFSDEIKKSIPKDVELVYWDYYQTTEQKYTDKFTSLKTLTSNYAFAGGAWKWIGFAPLNSFTIRSMSFAISAAKKADVKHFVLTSWGDNGAEASIFSILPSLIYIANQFYDDKLSNDDEISLLLSGYTFDELLDLDLVNQIYPSKEHIAVNPSKYLLFEDILLGNINTKVNMNYKFYYHEITEKLSIQKDKKGSLSYLFRTLYDLSKVLTLKSTLGLDLYHAYHKDDRVELIRLTTEVIPKLLRDLSKFYESFKYQWYLENKKIGFEVQSYRIGGLIKRIEEVESYLESYLTNEISSIPELEERIVNLSEDDDPYNGTSYNNQFSKNITYGNL